MSFRRLVKIGSIVYSEHEVRTIMHEYDNNQTSIMVLSTNEITDRLETWYTHELDDTLTFALAEDYVSGLEAFEEYIDDNIEKMNAVLDILNDVDDNIAEKLTVFYKEWHGDNWPYYVGDRRQYEGKLYRCVQDHRSQPDWAPPLVPALWVRTVAEGEIADWTQPAGAHDAYQKGDKVKYNGQIWFSTADNNVWAPGVYGWEVVE